MQNTGKITLTRLVKFAISVGVFGATGLRSFLSRLMGRKPRGTCVVLYYHSVPADQRDRFARQLDILLRHAQLIDVTKGVELKEDTFYAGITFDDAFENFFDQALPELKKRRIPATMFVISEALGKTFGPSSAPEEVMSAQQLCSLPADLVTIGSHTMTHPFMPQISEENARRELLRSKTSLEFLLNREIPTFSFPFGGFSQRLVEICREVGYRRVFTTLPSFAFVTEPDQFVVGRVRVDPTDWPIEFRMKLAGAYRWIPTAIAVKSRLNSKSSDDSVATTPTSEKSIIRELSNQ